LKHVIGRELHLGQRYFRAAAAVRDRGVQALQPTNLRVVFVTHLHSDHTVGFPDLIFTPGTLGRRVPLEAYGPKGIKAMTDSLLEAYRLDIETRKRRWESAWVS
jgi:ribonuclease BN (tRNA processing enzyme)